MRTILAIALLISCVGWSDAFSAGTVENVQFYSDALDMNRAIQVYLPDGYDPEGSTDYPAIYFLHGAGGSHLDYPELIIYLNNLIETEQIEPVIVIKPDGGGCLWLPYWEGCGWVNSELQGNYEDFLVQDVIAFAEANYLILQDPEKRAIMGHSMGAFGSMHAALRHPDMFVAVAALSGYLHFDEMWNQHMPLIINEQYAAHGDPPWEYTLSDGVFTGAWFMLAGGFSPNLDNPPNYVDLPMDPYGDVIPAVWTRWLEHDPATIASSLPPPAAPEIYFDCGTGDGFYLHPINVAFDTHLTDLGIPHEFQSFAGGHYVPARLAIALEFIDDAFQGVTAVGESDAVHGGLSVASFRVQNPARESVAVYFETVTSGQAMLDVFDIHGRHTASIVTHHLQAGTHLIRWDTGGIPAGVYFLRLNTAGGRATQKVVVP
jgi:S-formylglutathione hydrolase FrmB